MSEKLNTNRESIQIIHNLSWEQTACILKSERILTGLEDQPKVITGRYDFSIYYTEDTELMADLEEKQKKLLDNVIEECKKD